MIELKIGYGLLCDCPSIQIIKQLGKVLTADENKFIDTLAENINMLMLHDIISNTEKIKAHRRLQNLILKILRE